MEDHFLSFLSIRPAEQKKYDTGSGSRAIFLEVPACIINFHRLENIKSMYLDRFLSAAKILFVI